MLIQEILHHLQELAPLARQEEYDNSGLQVGRADVECTGALVCVDVTASVVNEAIELGCNLIISHHPLLFKPLRHITGATMPEQCVMMALSAGVAVYSSHTSLDNAPKGVSWKMAQMLGLEQVQVLQPQSNRMLKLSVYVPTDHVDTVCAALFEAGAGRMGEYEHCVYRSQGIGSWRPLPGAHPSIGEVGQISVQAEERLELILPVWKKNSVEQVLKSVHPYEEPAYEFVSVSNCEPHAGSGAVGLLPSPIPASKFVLKIKDTFGSPVARCSQMLPDAMVQKVALCGGSGAFLIPDAIAAGADVYLTSDTKYHDFVDCGNQILLVDIGHYESEQCTKSIFYHLIREIFPNFAVRYSQQDINPIKYM